MARQIKFEKFRVNVPEIGKGESWQYFGEIPKKAKDIVKYLDQVSATTSAEAVAIMIGSAINDKNYKIE